MSPRQIVLMVAGMAGLLFLLILLLCSFSLIPAGSVGVVTTFGRVDPTVLDEGFNWVAPWRSVHKLTLQTQEDKEAASVPTREGLTVNLEVSLLYSLEWPPDYKNSS